MINKGKLQLGTLACILAVPVWAQQQQQPGVSAGANIGGAQTGAPANIGQQASGPIVLNLSGMTVTDQSGRQLGQIQHLLMNPGGCADLVVLSMNNKLVPIPWQLVSSGGGASGTTGAQGRGTLVANVDALKLQQAPSFTMNQMSQITQQQTVQQVYNYYGVQGRAEGAGGTSSQTGSTTGAGTQGGTTNTAVPPQIGQTNQSGTTNIERSRPGLGLGRPENRPPSNRPPTNRPPENRPPTTPGNPGQGPE